MRLRTSMLAALAAWTVAGAAWAASPQPAPEARVIVAWRADAELVRRQPLAALGSDRQARQRTLQQRADRLAAGVGVALRSGRALGERTQVVRGQGLDSAALAARLAARAEVAWAVPDQRRRPLLVPNDPLFPAAVRARGPDAGQWYLQAPDATLRSAVNAQTAWDRTLGSASVVVAVLDTGVLGTHPDLASQMLPGIDTIDDLLTANDGDAEDADASDPGDWITADEDRAGDFAGCGVSGSSWHGTQVASIVAAAGGDGVGMSGTAPGVRILPVRVMGKCGGYDSDIIAGMLWAGGLEPVAGMVNANPAQVLNMSLGGSGSCTAAYRDAVQRLNDAGVSVVAAAGNSVGQAVGTPANCPGVIAVAGLRHAGTKVGFSDLGPEIAISAPGGNCVNIETNSPCLYPILAATNYGTRAPLAESMAWTDSYDITVGTSFAAPIVAGTAALMLSVQPGLTPGALLERLRASARPFPTSGADNGPSDPTPVPVCRTPDSSEQLQCYCTTSVCGAGMLDASAAVAAAAGVLARIDVSPALPEAGTAVSLDGSASVAGSGRSIATYAWALVDAGGIVTGFDSGADAAVARLTPTAAGSFRVRLTVTDDLGAAASVEQQVVVAAAPQIPPTPPTPEPGGGGGAMGASWLLALLVATGLLARKPRAGA